jgi:SNF family Na+-dependent transporter
MIIFFIIGLISSFISSILLVPETIKACYYHKVKMNREYLFLRLLCCLLNLIYGIYLFINFGILSSLPLLLSQTSLLINVLILYLIILCNKNEENKTLLDN